MVTAEEWIETLQMREHPEGGYYCETYRSAGTIPTVALPEVYTGKRNFSTAIYFLLKAGEVSHFHRLHSDELWHLYAGGPLELTLLYDNGMVERIELGCTPRAGRLPQVAVPGATWMAADCPNADEYALVGCTVSPGFDFADFELAERAKMIKLFPRHAELIKHFTRV